MVDSVMKYLGKKYVVNLHGLYNIQALVVVAKLNLKSCSISSASVRYVLLLADQVSLEH